ncbi:GNAT superfamily N-acetyltransferase [Rhizobium tibeticum]|nr:GNAT superfamily N-acetyltransferase [Rhizobium tibeticum]
MSDLHRSERTGLIAVALGLNPYRGFYERLDGVPMNGGTIMLGSAVVDQVAYLWEDIAELTLEVVNVTTDEQWRAYHGIRRTILFEARGLTGYDANHPDDRMPGHIPLLLMLGSRAVGAARLDLMADREACVRTVAIKQDFQRKGYGRALMVHLEALASSHSVEKLVVNAARDAVGFYRAFGWTIVDAVRDNPVLTKELGTDV